ncbi:hypothetical protein APHAL10511_005075 [Amanita phalloides]|nr:hypothetical protein APHAL10511_005075 [Amanita phalloides]
MKLSLFVVLARLALLAATGSRPRRRNVGKSTQFSKRNNLTDVHYTNSDLSIRDTECCKHTGHSGPSDHPPMISVPLEKNMKTLVWTAMMSIENIEFTGKVLVDTGAIDLLVFPHKDLPENMSGQMPETFDISYMDNRRVEGIVHSGTVSLGSIILDNQYFGGARRVVTGYFEWDGVLGLPPFPAVRSSIHHPNFLHEAIKQHKIFPKFAIKPGAAPQLHFGIDHDAYTSSIEYHKIVVDAIDWTLKDCYITVQRPGQHGTVSILQLPIHRTHIDSGAGLIFGDPRTVKGLYKELGGKKSENSWVLPCHKKPAISISWGKGKDWKIHQFNLGLLYEGSPNCIGAIQETFGSDWTVGAVFLEHVYSVYDVAEMKVGFAELSAHAHVSHH